MAKVKLTRPEGDGRFTQSPAEKDMMAYMVIFGVSKMAAWMRFHPEHVDIHTGKLIGEGTLAYKEFFDMQQNKEFVKCYRATLSKRVAGQEVGDSSDDTATMISDERKNDALTLLLDQALRVVEKGETLDPETLKLVAELFKKLNILKENENVVMEPLRFLPTLCSECRYKAYMESLATEGEAIDCCEYCKCRKIAESQGYYFNGGKNLLDIPKDVSERIEEKNKVKLEDIISGLIEN